MFVYFASLCYPLYNLVSFKSLIFSDEEYKTKKVTTAPNPTQNPPSTQASRPPTPKKPWLTLVSYVDELTVGGRRDSQGRYIDGLGSFPGFGRNKTVKTPQDCFPQHCYQR